MFSVHSCEIVVCCCFFCFVFLGGGGGILLSEPIENSQTLTISTYKYMCLCHVRTNQEDYPLCIHILVRRGKRLVQIIKYLE